MSSTKKDQSKGRERYRNIALVALPLLLVAFGWYNVVNTANRLEDNTIRTYQDAELEVVTNAARAANVYIEGELSRRGTDPDTITEVEREVLAKFVSPIKIGTVGDAWIYSPDYVVFDGSPDFPEEYRGKSMAQIFEIQKDSGAFHYEDMTTAVSEGVGGTGWYVWDPAKAEESTPMWEFLTDDSGREIAAWTPVVVFPNTDQELTWLIGMSSMLPDLMTSNGAYDQIESSIYQMLIVTLMVVGLLVFLLRAEAQVQELRQQVQELRVEIDQSRRAEQVSEIVESEYFQDLAKRAKSLRDRSDS